MCVVVFKPFGLPAMPGDWAKNACDANSDGHGFVIRRGAGKSPSGLDLFTLETHHSFDDQAAADLMSSLGEDTEVLFHARWATHGLKDIANLHPFAMYDEKYDKGVNPYAYLVHNGVVAVPIIDKDKSDTWHLARMLEKAYGSDLVQYVRQARWRKKFNKRFGSGGKYAFMDYGGVHIIGAEKGMWKDGVWASNDTAFEGPRFYRGWSSTEADLGANWSKDPVTGAWHYMDHQDSFGSADAKWWGEQSDEAWANELRSQATKSRKRLTYDGDDHPTDDAEYKLRFDSATQLVTDIFKSTNEDDIEELLYEYSNDELALAFAILTGRRAKKSQTKTIVCRERYPGASNVCKCTHTCTNVTKAAQPVECLHFIPDSTNPCSCKDGECPINRYDNTEPVCVATDVEGATNA